MGHEKSNKVNKYRIFRINKLVKVNFILFKVLVQKEQKIRNQMLVVFKCRSLRTTSFSATLLKQRVEKSHFQRQEVSSSLDSSKHHQHS